MPSVLSPSEKNAWLPVYTPVHHDPGRSHKTRSPERACPPHIPPPCARHILPFFLNTFFPRTRMDTKNLDGLGFERAVPPSCKTTSFASAGKTFLFPLSLSFSLPFFSSSQETNPNAGQDGLGCPCRSDHSVSTSLLSRPTAPSLLSPPPQRAPLRTARSCYLTCVRSTKMAAADTQSRRDATTQVSPARWGGRTRWVGWCDQGPLPFVWREQASSARDGRALHKLGVVFHYCMSLRKGCT